MPRNTDQIMALADVYAEALLGAAAATRSEEEVFREFGEIVGYMDRDPAFALFLTADTVDDDPRRESLEKIFRGRINDLLLNLLQVLNNRGRLDLIREVYRCVELRMEARHDQQEVIVETAMPLSDNLRSLVKSRVGRHIGKEALLVERVAPDLIGGVVIRIKDLQIDGSIATRIRMLRERFSERAIHEIYGRRGFEGE